MSPISFAIAWIGALDVIWQRYIEAMQIGKTTKGE